MSLVSVVCCQVEVSASGRSLVQRSPTECGVPECDREVSTMWRPWPIRGCCVMGGGGNKKHYRLNPRVHSKYNMVNPLKAKRICFI
jgi:hypothetical protein